MSQLYLFCIVLAPQCITIHEFRDFGFRLAIVRAIISYFIVHKVQPSSNHYKISDNVGKMVPNIFVSKLEVVDSKFMIFIATFFRGYSIRKTNGEKKLQVNEAGNLNHSFTSFSLRDHNQDISQILKLIALTIFHVL